MPVACRKAFASVAFVPDLKLTCVSDFSSVVSLTPRRMPHPVSSCDAAGAPVDLDEQCGVMTDKNLPCSRSLTCKTHGMGSKRALEGRSKPYDTLLAEFQKRKEVRLEAKKRNEAVREAEKAKQAASAQEQNQAQQQLSSSMAPLQQYPGQQQQQQNGSQAYLSLPGQLNHLDNYIQQQQQPYLSQQQSQQSGPGKVPSPSQSQFQPLATMQNSQSSVPQFSPKLQNQHQSPPQSSSSAMNKSLSKASSSQLLPPAGSSQKASSGSAPTSSSKVSKSSTSTGVNGNNKASASTLANGSQQAAAGTSSGKKKGTGERKRTTTKASKASKADLILGEVDDPPEPLPGSAAALAADQVEEEAPDSDDELEQLLMAIGNSRAKPLAVQQVPALHVGRAQRMIRLREGFTTAFTGRSLSSTVA